MGRSRKILLKGERVLLRTLTREDSRDIQVAANDPEIAKYTPVPYPFSLEDEVRLIDRSRNQINRGRDFFLGIEFTNVIVGMMGLLQVNHSEQKAKAEVGYWIGKDYRGRGLARESLGLILNFGFYSEGLERIWGRVTDGNIPSMKLLESCGFTQIARFPKIRSVGETLVDDLVYELTRRQYTD